MLGAIEVYQGTQLTRLAIKLIALTFVRTSELIGAQWSEVDMAAARRNIPQTDPYVPECACGLTHGEILTMRRTYESTLEPRLIASASTESPSLSRKNRRPPWAESVVEESAETA